MSVSLRGIYGWRSASWETGGTSARVVVRTTAFKARGVLVLVHDNVAVKVGGLSALSPPWE
jgi:hypothetical protein